MTMRRRLASLEGLAPVEPVGSEPEPAHLPPLAEFEAMGLEEQQYILLCWNPPPSGVELPRPEELARMPAEDLNRLMVATERPGRETLLPFVECLPVPERIRLLREATHLLPAGEMWRLRTFRLACRPEWKRQTDGEQKPCG
jgi:hypothetical protein